MDVRYQKDIKSYAAWQAGNRQLNREMLEFQRMQEHYAKKKQPAPYTTLGSFRKARRSDTLSPAFKKWRYRKADENQYNRWKEIIGEENMPEDVDKFQEIKYNKDKQETFLLMLHYKTSVDNGDVAAISGFANYKNQYTKIKGMIFGNTFDSVKIKSASYHFIDRTVGSIYYTYSRGGKPIKHEGVSVQDSFTILRDGKSRPIVYDSKGRASQKFVLKGVGDVTINPETGELVQVNRDE